MEAGSFKSFCYHYAVPVIINCYAIVAVAVNNRFALLPLLLSLVIALLPVPLLTVIPLLPLSCFVDFVVLVFIIVLSYHSLDASLLGSYYHVVYIFILTVVILYNKNFFYQTMLSYKYY